MALARITRRPSRIAFPGFGTATLPVFEDVENRMNRFMERVLNEPFSGIAMPEPISWMPAMDIVETSNELTLTAELPGMDQKDIDVSVEEGILTIRGEKMEERKEEENKKVYLFERSYGSFQRSFSLPPGVNASKIGAEFEKGVLKVHLPKDGDAKPKGRKVEIKSA